MTGSPVLYEAWKRVKANRGAAGIDGKTIEAVERQGVGLFLKQLQEDLLTGRYRAQAVRRKYIPKADGRKRPLGIPTVRDRVAQMAAKIVLEPIFEADFEECSYGFRPRRSVTQALEVLRKAASEGYEWALEIDIEKYFDTISHEKLMELVERRINDRKMLKLTRMWLRAGVLEEEGKIRETEEGTPQGGVISPLLANIYLHELDAYWRKECKTVGRLVRYADDAAIVCKNESCAKEARRRVERKLSQRGLKLHPEKTRIAHLRRKGIDFLGCHLRMGCSRRSGRWYLYRWPSVKAMKKIRTRIREITAIQHSGRRKVEQVLEELNPVLRGWGEAFRSGNAARKFGAIDAYVQKRLVIYQNRRRGRNRPTWKREFDYAWYRRLNLVRLIGIIRYPGAANAG
jgi:group II intron reverse transcriptase/maturase